MPKINLASTRLAFVLIALLVLHIILSAIIPQKDIAVGEVAALNDILTESHPIIEKLALDRIYYAPPFFVLLGLLTVNLTFGSIQRFRAVYRAERTLMKARHVGSILFHLSLVVIMLGIVGNYLYKFEGVMALTEGQQLPDIQDSYSRVFSGPLFGDEMGRFEVRLDDIDPAHRIDDATTAAAHISIRPNNAVNPIGTVIHTNRPYQWSDLEFHFGLLTGYSPKLILQSADSGVLFDGIVRLAVQNIDGSPVHADFILLPPEDLRINIEAHEQSVDDEDSVSLKIRVESRTDRLYIGTMRAGDSVSFGEYRLTVPEIRRWCYISVVKSPFLTVIFTAFWTALAGLLIGFIPRLTAHRRSR